jgi:hypothetical protein
MSEVQAKRGYLKVKKPGKYGGTKIGRQEMIVSGGMMDARTMDRELQKAADSSPEEVVDAVTEVFDSREVAPAAWEPLMHDHRSQTAFSGFQSPMNQWQPESPLIRQLQSRRKGAT